jgi:acyl-CoA synthetase (NDP forming)
LPADQLASNELAVAALSADTVKRLNGVHPVPAGASNPLDIWPAIQARGANVAIGALLAPVLDDPGVDATVLIMGAFSGGGTDFDPSGLSNVIHASRKPVMAWLYGPSRYVRAWEEALARIGVPAFGELRTVASALAGINALATYRTCAHPSAIARKHVAPESATKIISAARALGVQALSEARGLSFARGLRTAYGALGNGQRRDWRGRSRSPHRLSGRGQDCLASDSAQDRARRRCDWLDGWRIRDHGPFSRCVRPSNKHVPTASIEGFLVQKMVKSRLEAIVGMTRSPAVWPGDHARFGWRFR